MESNVNDFQNSYNSYMEEQVSKTFGSKVGSGFRAFQHSGGFNYMTNDGSRYNIFTLQCLDSQLTQDSSGKNLDLDEGAFSTLYCNVLSSARYTLSKESQKKVSDALIAYSGQAAAVIREYKNAGLPELTSDGTQAQIAEIYKNCAREFGGEVTKDCSIIPDSYLQFKVALQTLNNMGGEASQLVMNQGNKNAVLSSIIDNMTNPGKTNGGVPVDTDPASYYVGYDKIPDSNSLIGSLQTESNAITINISGESYDSDYMTLHLENHTKFNIPVLGLIDIEVDHKSTFDMDKLKTSDMTVDASITYSGLTVVPVQPAPASINGATGWYSETNILEDIRKNTGDDSVDGYKLIDKRYEVSELFGGELAHLKTMLLSKEPSITIKLSNIDIDYAHSVFTTENDVSVKLFGFISLGGHSNSYKTTSISYDYDEKSVTLTFGEPDVSGTPDVKSLTAFIMGGVPEYPGMN